NDQAIAVLRHNQALLGAQLRKMGIKSAQEPAPEHDGARRLTEEALETIRQQDAPLVQEIVQSRQRLDAIEADIDNVLQQGRLAQTGVQLRDGQILQLRHI